MEQEIDEFGNKQPIDNYVEHPLHFKYDEHCSECFKENKVVHSGVEETNKKQDSNLSKLRASIEAQRKARVSAETIKNTFGEEILKPLELKPVPEITFEDNTEFNLERHGQLCERADVLYHNFLVGKQSLVLSDDNSIMAFEWTIKELCGGIDEVVDEGTKIRWS